MELRLLTAAGATDLTQLVTEATWSGDYQQAARTLRFSLLHSPTDRLLPQVDCPLGAGVRMTHGGKLLFDGFLIAREKGTGQQLLTCTCYDRGFYLMRNRTNYKFVDVTPEEAAAQVAGEFGLQVGELARTGVKVSRNFLGVRLYEILATLYTLASGETGEKYHIGFQGERLVVARKGPDSRTLVIQGGSNLISASTRESIEKLVSAVAIYDRNDRLLRVEEDGERLRLYGRMQEYLKQTAQDDKSGAARALLEEGDVAQRITVDCLGNPANTAGGTVVVKEPYTGLYGLFYIDSDQHQWKRGQYYNKLVLNFRRMMDEKEAGSLPNRDGGRTAG